MSWERKELLRWNKKNIFYLFKRAFIEANKAIFLEGEGPTLSSFSLNLDVNIDVLRRNNFVLFSFMFLSTKLFVLFTECLFGFWTLVRLSLRPSVTKFFFSDIISFFW